MISPLVHAAVRGSWFSRPLELMSDGARHFDFFTLRGLTWIDWASIAGLVLTVVGFGITWWQLYRTRTAREAVNDTRSELNRNTAGKRLSRTLPSLHTLYDKAREAAEEEDKKQLRSQLEGWSIKCTQVIAQVEQLQERRADHRWSRNADKQRVADVLSQLRSAQGRVREALLKMDEHPDMVDLEKGVRYALMAMREFSDLAVAMVEENRYLRKVS